MNRRQQGFVRNSLLISGALAVAVVAGVSLHAQAQGTASTANMAAATK